MKKTIEQQELFLYIENEADIYERHYIYVIRNLSRKKQKGTYDSKLATKAMLYIVEEGAKKYVKEHGSAGDKWHEMFDKATRELVAEDLKNKFEQEYENQEYDFMKSHKKLKTGR